MKLEFFSIDLEQILKYQILWNSAQEEAELFYADMTKLIVAFHNFAEAPKCGWIYRYTLFYILIAVKKHVKICAFIKHDFVTTKLRDFRFSHLLERYALSIGK
jgi:hypothetical protein